MSLYRCYFEDDGIVVYREFVGASIDEIENQAAVYAHTKRAVYLRAEFVCDVEVAA